MPANPAVAPPIAHVTVARRFGDHPSDDHRPLVLRARGDREPDPGEPGEGPQREREHDRDAEQDQAVLLDDDASHRAVEPEPSVQRVVVGGQELVDLVEVVVPELLPGEPLEHDQHAERRDEADERGGRAHEAQDAVLDDDTEERGEQHGDRDRRPDRPAVVLDQRQEAEEGAEHRDGAVREVDDARTAVDEDDALCEQRVRRTGAESEDRELNCLGHDSLRRSSTRRHLERSLDVLRDVDRCLVRDDVLAVESRDVHEVVRARLEHAEPWRRRRPRWGEPQEIDVLRASCSAPTTVAGVNESSALVTFTKASVEIQGPKSEVLRLAWAEAALARRLHVGEVLLEPGEGLGVRRSGTGTNPRAPCPW